MTNLKRGLLLASLGLSVAPVVSHAATTPFGDVPVAVQNAAAQMAKACSAWPEVSAPSSSSSRPAPINLAALQDRGLCDDAIGPDKNVSSRDRDVVLLIMAAAFFALVGFYATLGFLWRYARSAIWRAKQWRFT